VADPFKQHQEILAAARELLAGVSCVPQIPMDMVNRLRTRLAAFIRAHRKTEEEEIFTPLFQNGGIDRLPQLKAAIRQIKEDKSRYSEIVRDWSPKVIEANWTGYVRLVTERVTHLEDMIRFEEERIYRPVLALKARGELALDLGRSATG
jgi:hypothetical protein